VVYAIGGQHATKKLPVAKMIELCKQVSLPLILIGGPEDKSEATQIVEALKEKAILNTCGNCNLNQSASLIQQSLWVISHDTGMMHVAAAFKRKLCRFGEIPFLNLGCIHIKRHL
jgi:heptosyltransferase-2